MSRHQLYVLSALVLSTLFFTLFADRPVAIWVNSHLQNIQPFFDKAIDLLELITGFTLGKYWIAIVLLSLSFVAKIFKKHALAKNLYFIGMVQLLSRVTAGVLKNVFLRSRPHQFLADESVKDFFSTAGNSFPSGHVAHFFGLVLPVVWLLPKLRWLMMVPLFVMAQRIISNDHYLGDTLASIFIALLFTYVFAHWLKISSAHKAEKTAPGLRALL